MSSPASLTPGMAEADSIAQIMSTPVVTVRTDEPVIRAAELMVQKQIGCVVVAEGGNVLGLVTERDVLNKLTKLLESPNLTVRDVMNQPPIVVSPSDHPLAALAIMMNKNIRRLPVIENGKLLGIITQRDLVKWILVHPKIVLDFSTSVSAVPSRETLLSLLAQLEAMRTPHLPEH